MLLVMHIAIALAGLVATGYTYFAPSQWWLRVSSALVGLTVVSGTALVVSTQSSMVHACMSGLLYVGVTMCGIIAARHKLAQLAKSD